MADRAIPGPGAPVPGPVGAPIPEPVEGSAAGTATVPEVRRGFYPDLTRLKPLRTPLLTLLRPLFHLAATSVWRTHLHHLDRVPKGGALLAVNHVGVFDGPLAVAVTPRSQAMAKMELWGHRPLGLALDLVGQVPIDRGHADPGAIRRCLQVLAAGRRLCIFPEGHRGKGDFSTFKPGVAYLALVSGVPVVPVALVGSSTGGIGAESIPRPGSHVHVVYGEPVVVEPKAWPRTTREVRDLAERLQAICQQHVQQAQREVGLELP